MKTQPRYRVEIPAFVVVYLDDNLRVNSHDLDYETPNAYVTPSCNPEGEDFMPVIQDYWQRNGELPVFITDIREAIDVWQNAYNYTKSLRLVSPLQILSGEDILASEEPF